MLTTILKQSTMKKFMILALLAVLLASCGGGQDKKAMLEELKSKHSALADEIKALEAEIALTDTTKRASKIKDVLVTEMQPMVFRHYIDVQGKVDADQNVDVQPLMAGKVQRVLVNEGDNVRAGQVLAEIEHDVYTKQLNSLQPQLALAKEMFERQQRLWDQKIGSEMQYLQAKSQKESMELQIETLKEQIDMAIVKAPISGTIDLVGIKVGQLASNMSFVPAFRIVNLSSLKIQGEIAESYASKVHTGNRVKVHFPDLNTDIESKISFVERVIDPMTRSFTAEVALSGENSQYHPNMVAILKVIDYENTNAITLPINVIQSSNNEQFVYVAIIDGNKTVAHKRVITTGNTYDGMAEVLTGLSANDKVVTTGQLDLVDGMLIQF
jgi:RND family efflux transporter MFP subunit